MTSALLFANNAETTLASATITVGDTSITVTSATGFPAANSGTGDYFYAIMYELTGAVETKVEIVKVTNLAGTS